MDSELASCASRDASLILIVEDIPAQVRILTTMLSPLDCRIAVASSSGDVLDVARQDPPDLVLLDLLLPGTDGIQVLQTLRNQEEFEHLPVIILTAKGNTEDILAGLESGTVDYIPNPFHPEELVARVKGNLPCRGMRNRENSMITELQETLGAIKHLSGMIPICAHCKKIRNDMGNWQHVEDYISNQTKALFTHGLCPDCAHIFFPEAAKAGLAGEHPRLHEAEMEPRSRILVVDDSPIDLNVLFQLFHKEYELLVATDGRVALEMAQNEHPDLILLDVFMPDIDGRDVCRALKADPRTDQIPVIFVTEKGQEIDETEGLELGAVDYITKPFSLPLVQARVRTHLELKHSRDTLMLQLLWDRLTGLRNRRSFLDFLEIIWRQALRQRTALALILFNVDHLKDFNQECGRQTGDESLKRIAATLKTLKRRSTDLIARYSDQEFACLLPGTDLKGAFRFAEMMREGVEGLTIPHSGAESPTPLTLSVGVAACEPAYGSDPSSLLEQAGQALFQARQGGRD